jgi:hypothetical protein
VRRHGSFFTHKIKQLAHHRGRAPRSLLRLPEAVEVSLAAVFDAEGLESVGGVGGVVGLRSWLPHAARSRA